MAELIGAIASGITLASLFKTCLEAFDLIQTSRHQEYDLKKLKLRLNIEKCRLYTWGESMGLTGVTESPGERPIDTFKFPELVREVLEVISQLFDDSYKMQDKYGCRQSISEDLLEEGEENTLKVLANSFSNFKIHSSRRVKDTSCIRKLTGVIHDREKFGSLVSELKDLVDSLPSVSVARQADTVKRNIAKTQDTETLCQIAEVCSEDHPDIAEVASTRADTISFASSDRRHVEDWTDSVRHVPDQLDDTTMFHLESLTITELKHKVLELMLKQSNQVIHSTKIEHPSQTNNRLSRRQASIGYDSVPIRDEKSENIPYPVERQPWPSLTEESAPSSCITWHAPVGHPGRYHGQNLNFIPYSIPDGPPLAPLKVYVRKLDPGQPLCPNSFGAAETYQSTTKPGSKYSSHQPSKAVESASELSKHFD